MVRMFMRSIAVLCAVGFVQGVASATIIDNLSNDFSTDLGWGNTSSVVQGYEGADYLVGSATNGSAGNATWKLNELCRNRCAIYAKWTAHSNRTSNAIYRLVSADTSTEMIVNQQVNGGIWYPLGVFNAISRIELSNQSDDQTTSSGYVIADAIKIVPEEEIDDGPVIDNKDIRFSSTARGWRASSTAVEGYYGTDYIPGNALEAGFIGKVKWEYLRRKEGQFALYAIWPKHPNRTSSAKFHIFHDGRETVVIIDQKKNGGIWIPLGMFENIDKVELYSDAPDQTKTTGFVIADAIKLTPYNEINEENIIDNSDSRATFTGGWGAPSTAIHGFYGEDYIPGNAAALGGVGMFSWEYLLRKEGAYELFTRWTSHTNRSAKATYRVFHDDGETTVIVNQKNNSGEWFSLGIFNGIKRVELSNNPIDQNATSGYVIADAINTIKINSPPKADFSCWHDPSFDMIGCWSEASDPDGYPASGYFEISDGTRYDNWFFDVHKLNGPGVHTVTFTVTDNLGATSSQTKSFEVAPNEPPKANFSCGVDKNSIVCFSQAFDPDGYPTNPKWYVNGVEVSSEWNLTYPTHSNGQYLVAFEIRDNKGLVDRREQSILMDFSAVHAIINCDLAGNLGVQCNANSSYSDDGSIVTFNWDVGDGHLYEGSTINHTYRVAKKYRVKLSVVDSNGQTGQVEREVDFESSKYKLQCSETGHLTVSCIITSSDGANSPDDLSVEWNFNGSIKSGGISEVNTFTDFGEKTVIAGITDTNGQKEVLIVNVILNTDASLEHPPFYCISLHEEKSLFCDGTLAKGMNSTINRYVWSFDGVVDGRNVDSIQMTFDDYKKILVRLTVYSSSGSSAYEEKYYRLVAQDVPPTEDIDVDSDDNGMSDRIQRFIKQYAETELEKQSLEHYAKAWADALSALETRKNTVSPFRMMEKRAACVIYRFGDAHLQRANESIEGIKALTFMPLPRAKKFLQIMSKMNGLPVQQFEIAESSCQ